MLPRYGRGEEIANAVSHGVAAAAGAVGFVLLVVATATTGDPVRVVSACLYSATLVSLYVASTLYHALPGSAARGVFRILDHSAIFLLIAGSYTPFCLVALGGPLGWALLSVVWALAIAGVVLTAVAITRTRAVAMVLYVGMGWCIVMVAGPLVRSMDPWTLVLVVAGGVVYTAGLVFYGGRFRFAHAMWHLFVVAASGLHWWAVYRVVA